MARTTDSNSGTETPRMAFSVKRIAPGYYDAKFEVKLFIDGHIYIKTATAEIFKREDGSGWSYTLSVPYASGVTSELSQCGDIYERKSHIVEFFKSPLSRRWQFLTDGGLNSWCLKLGE